MFRRCKACSQQFNTLVFGNKRYCSEACRVEATSGTVTIEGMLRTYKFTSLRGKHANALEQIIREHENTGVALRVQFTRRLKNPVKSQPKLPKTNCMCCDKPLVVIRGHQRSFYCSMSCKKANRYTWIPFLLQSAAQGLTAYWCAAQIGVSSKLVYTWTIGINAALAGSGKQLNFKTK